jgi:hypothetical protein
MKEYDASDYHLDSSGLKAVDGWHNRKSGMQAGFKPADELRECARRH